MSETLELILSRLERVEAAVVPAPPTPQAQSPPLVSSPSQLEEEELAREARPSLYPHTPRRRQDTLLTTFRAHPEAGGLDVLKLKELQGFYNLAALLLVFSLGYITARNVLEHGFRQDVVRDFLCQEALRDVVISAGVSGVSLALSFAVYGLQAALVAGWLARTPMLYLYVSLQLTSLVASTAIVYTTPIGPLAAAGAMCCTLVLSLKCHSYVATNLALEREREAAGDGGGGGADTPSEAGDSGGRDVIERGSGDGAAQEDGEPEASVRKRKGDPSDLTASSSASSSASSHVSCASRAAHTKFPANVTLYNFAYFLACPSLVYEPYFPRTTTGTRWAFVARKSVELLLCVSLMYAVMTQFMLPVLAKPTPYGPVMDMAKLAMPSMIVWITGFYAMFHCALNINAEILHYADARFYGPWWSATDLRSFWSLWNRPVHEFLLRHVYVEAIHYADVSKTAALLVVFVLSAAVHEVVFSAAFKTVTGWFALGMLAQIPLIHFSSSLKGTRRGNFLVWLSLFLGQPMIELLYFRHYMATHNNEFFCVKG